MERVPDLATNASECPDDTTMTMEDRSVISTRATDLVQRLQAARHPALALEAVINRVDRLDVIA